MFYVFIYNDKFQKVKNNFLKKRNIYLKHVLNTLDNSRNAVHDVWVKKNPVNDFNLHSILLIVKIHGI